MNTETTLTAQELALYLGCDAITTKSTYKNPQPGKMLNVDLWGQPFEAISIHTDEGYYLCSAEECKLILRPFSEITKAEAIECGLYYQGKMGLEWNELLENLTFNLEKDTAHFSPKQFCFLLSKGIDLFNWIEQGKAIPKTTA